MPTTITANRLKGRQITVTQTIGAGTPGAVTHWKDLEITPKYEIENPQGSDAGFKQKVLDIRDCTGRISVFMGAAHNTFTLPNIGDEIEITVALASESLIETFSEADWGKCRVTSKPYKFGKDSAEVAFDIEWGFID